MANEVSKRTVLSVSYGGVTSTVDVTKTTSLTSPYTRYQNSVTVTSAATVTLTVPAAADPIGEFWMKNKDATNFIKIGFVNPPTEMLILPGDTICFRPQDTTAPVIYAKADTADCEADYGFAGAST